MFTKKGKKDIIEDKIEENICVEIEWRKTNVVSIYSEKF